MAKAIRFHETGGPEVMKIESVEVVSLDPAKRACGIRTWR